MDGKASNAASQIDRRRDQSQKELSVLKPTFSEQTALAVRDRLVKWLREHFNDASHWASSTPSDYPSIGEFVYVFPQVMELAVSGKFDDIAESVLLRVLKDMNNFGTITLERDESDNRNASSHIIISLRLLVPLPDGVEQTDDGYFTENLAVFD